MSNFLIHKNLLVESELYYSLELLKRAERHIVTLYRGMIPHANYDTTENAFADLDEKVITIRKQLEKYSNV